MGMTISKMLERHLIEQHSFFQKSIQSAENKMKYPQMKGILQK